MERSLVVLACILQLPSVAQAGRPGEEVRGVALLQTRQSDTSHTESFPASTLEEDLQASQVRQAELEKEVQELRQRLRECTSAAGFCAIFGDPHFTTFDGAHTILLRQQTLWVVKSQNVWIQALALETSGDLMGLAISGPFMNGHTLIFANTSVASPEGRPFTVLLDGDPILDNWDDQGRAEFSLPGILWATRRAEWNLFLHDAEVLAVDEVVEFDVGSWSSRFDSQPYGGVYLFRLPEGVALTATGADLMSAVLKMRPQTGGQTGYCGNFNGNAADDFTPPAAGTVHENLVAAWNIPVGEDLEPVPEDFDLFKMSMVLKDLLPASQAAAAKLGSDRQSPEVGSDRQFPEVACSPELLTQAQAACSKIDQPALRAACLTDVCRSGNVAAADGVLAVGILDGEVKGRSVLGTPWSVASQSSD